MIPFFENTHYTVVIPETSERFIAHSVSHSTFYQGAEVADDTEGVFKVTLTKQRNLLCLSSRCNFFRGLA